MNDYFELRYQQEMIQGAIFCILFLLFGVYVLGAAVRDLCRAAYRRFRSWKEGHR